MTRIGLTYDLRSEYLALGFGEEETAEFDSEQTIEAIEAALLQLGHAPVRIGNARQLIERLARGERWDLVFNICEGLGGLGREAQVPAILEVYGIPYTFSDALVMALSLHKGFTKTVVAAAGVPVPRQAIVERTRDVELVSLPYPLFVKPVAEGTGKGVDPSSVVRDPRELERACVERLERFRQPVLVEEYLPGRELTVGLLGNGGEAEVLGTLEIVLKPQAEAGAYSYVNKERWQQLIEIGLVGAQQDEVVGEAQRIALLAWQALGCVDAGRVDLRCGADGRPRFLEVNPLAGLHPVNSDLPILCAAVGLPYQDLIARIVRSALARSAAASRPELRPSVGPAGGTCA